MSTDTRPRRRRPARAGRPRHPPADRGRRRRPFQPLSAMARRPSPTWPRRSASRRPTSTSSSIPSRRSARRSASSAWTRSCRRRGGVADGKTATEKFRRFSSIITEKSAELFFQDKMLYDIAAYSATENWPSAITYLSHVEAPARDHPAGPRDRRVRAQDADRRDLRGDHAGDAAVHASADAGVQSGRPARRPTQVINLVLRSLAP
jgi:hypothetical protein